MVRSYRVSLEVDLSAIEKVDACPESGVVIFHLEVDGDSAESAIFSAFRHFADDVDVVAVVPVREG